MDNQVPVADLPARHAALNFLFPRAFQPLFGHDWVEVTREAAEDVANAFNSLVFRGEDRVCARRFILQCVVALFAEDIGLLPQDLFTRLLDEPAHQLVGAESQPGRRLRLVELRMLGWSGRSFARIRGWTWFRHFSS
jgi:hypothetical protein